MKGKVKGKKTAETAQLKITGVSAGIALWAAGPSWR
jgi:hypothetical protein